PRGPRSGGGARAPTGAPDQPNDLPLLDPLAELHIELLQVGVARLHAVTVGQRDVLAIASLGARGDDPTRRWRRDRRPRRTADVDPGVTLPRAIPGGVAQPVLRLDWSADRPA